MTRRHVSSKERELKKVPSEKDYKRWKGYSDSMPPERRAEMARMRAERETAAPHVGEQSPDFTLPRLDGSNPVRLSSFCGIKAVALIFGSFTWPPFRAQSGDLERIYRRFKQDIEFFVVYIREAHPTDGWQVEANERDGVQYAQPKILGERLRVAEACSLRLALSIPTLIDDMDDSTDRKYYALPDRLYLVGRDGRIAYRGKPGPFGFVAAELEEAIVDYLKAEPMQLGPEP